MLMELEQKVHYTSWTDNIFLNHYLSIINIVDVIRWGLQTPGGVAIDWIHDLLFWTDSGTRRVEVVTLDTNIRHVIISSDIDKPRAIAVHPNFGYIYWTDWGNLFILKSYNLSNIKFKFQHFYQQDHGRRSNVQTWMDLTEEKW